MLSSTLVPFSPRIFFIASSSERPSVEAPSILMIRSPPWMPARHAGVPSMGEITVTQLSRIPIEIPIPPKEPCVVVSRPLRLLLVEVLGVGVERAEHPANGRIHELVGRDRLDVMVAHLGQDLDESLDVRVGIVGRFLNAPHSPGSRQEGGHEDEHREALP
jgi:hypothetical protein